MGFPKCNQTEEFETIHEKEVFHDLTFHHLGLIVSAAFGLVAVVVSMYLILQHAMHYSRPWEQKHIIRVVFMVPVYAVVSFLSYLYYRHSVYFEVIRDCYEAFAIASFFSLLCHYIATDLHSQKDYFRTIVPKPWVWPITWLKKVWGGEQGIWRTPRSGLTWFNVIWTGVFQYCFVRVFMTLVAVITQAAGRYCLESLNPAFSHIWVMAIESIGVTIAMYCLIQFYIQLRQDIKQHSPFMKILSIKLVIFLSFWQSILISLLTSSDVIKPTDELAMPDVKIGIPSLLLCIEMALFAFLHLWSFPWGVYDVKRSALVASESAPGYPPTKELYQGGFLGTKAIWEAFNLWDVIKAFGRSIRWLFVGRKTRHEDISYKTSRQDTDLSTTSPDRNIDSSYAGAQLGDMKGRPHHHPPRSASYEEDQELLSHAQSNPTVLVSSERGDLGSTNYPPSYPPSSNSSVYNYGDNAAPERYSREPSPYGRGPQQQQMGVIDHETRPYTGYYTQGPGGIPPRFPPTSTRGYGGDDAQGGR